MTALTALTARTRPPDFCPDRSKLRRSYFGAVSEAVDGTEACSQKSRGLPASAEKSLWKSDKIGDFVRFKVYVCVRIYLNA